jgi:hypothetical protein
MIPTEEPARNCGNILLFIIFRASVGYKLARHGCLHVAQRKPTDIRKSQVFKYFDEEILGYFLAS